jgi:hypothetical protein
METTVLTTRTTVTTTTSATTVAASATITTTQGQCVLSGNREKASLNFWRSKNTEYNFNKKFWEELIAYFR